MSGDLPGPVANSLANPLANPPAGDSRPASLTMNADALSLRKLGPWVTDLLAGAGEGAAALQGRVELAVHEVCMNVVDHAYALDHDPSPADIEVAGWLDDDAVRIRVTDRGSGFERDAVSRPQPGVPQIRGYGLLIVEKLADDVQYLRADGRNTWTLRFHRTRDNQES
jgi:serine/threonine-protein kinase RsbW